MLRCVPMRAFSFFFSSRRRHTRSLCDWSSDVCSSDLIRTALVHAEQVSQDLRRNANKEAELIVREAKERAHRILADSSSRVERVQESYEVLRKAKQDFANDFRRLLRGYLAVMDNIDVASAKEIEASLRERLDLESVAAARAAAETRAQSEAEDDRTTRSAEV